MTEPTKHMGPQLNRREFTAQTILTLLSGVVVTVVGCDDSDSPMSPGPSGGETGTVSANHGHVATIDAAELSAGNAVTLDIRGTADHPHSVQLTMAEVVQISNGQRVTKASSTAASATEPAHNHTVTFN